MTKLRPQQLENVITCMTLAGATKEIKHKTVILLIISARKVSFYCFLCPLAVFLRSYAFVVSNNLLQNFRMGSAPEGRRETIRFLQ